MQRTKRRDTHHTKTKGPEGGTWRQATIIAVLSFALLGLAAWLVFGGSSEDPAAALEQQLTGVTAERDALTQQLADVTAERDGLRARVEQRSDRYDKTVAVQAAVRDILDNPAAYGTEEEVAELLATYATGAAVMEDDVFGAVGMRDAWYKTLFSGTMDASIEVWHQWTSEDGSQSGGLWVWRGTNLAGNPFELIGVALDTHDDEGLISHELVIYPYSHNYVMEAVIGGGTASGDS